MHVRFAAFATLALALPGAAQVSGPVWIHGRVSLPAGCPSADPVEILLRRGEPRAPVFGGLLAGARVDAEGEFGFWIDPPERGFFLALEARWLELRPLWIELRPGESSLEVALVPALRGILHGRFVASSELPLAARPLAGSWVWIDGVELHATEVNPEGEFELCGPAAEMGGALSARPRAFAPLQVDAPALHDGESTELILPLLEPASIRGRVVDSSGNGLAGLTLSCWRGLEALRPLALSPWGEIELLTSGPDGQFEGADLPPGDLTLHVEDPRWRTLGFQVCQLLPGEVRDGLELRLLRAASLRGVVVDEFAAPIAGARVTAGMRERAGGLMVATTDAHGRYAFDAALPGEYVLSASFDGRAGSSTGPLSLPEGSREESGVLLGRGSALRIVLSDHAAPVLLRVTDGLGFLRADQRVWQGELELTLPPGIYKATLVERDGTRRERKFALSGREARPVTLWM